MHFISEIKGRYQQQNILIEQVTGRAEVQQLEAIKGVVDQLKLNWQITCSLTSEIRALKHKQTVLEKGQLQGMQQQLQQMQQKAKALDTKVEVLHNNFQAVAQMPLKLEALEQNR